MTSAVVCTNGCGGASVPVASSIVVSVVAELVISVVGSTVMSSVDSCVTAVVTVALSVDSCVAAKQVFCYSKYASKLEESHKMQLNQIAITILMFAVPQQKIKTIRYLK